MNFSPRFLSRVSLTSPDSDFLLLLQVKNCWRKRHDKDEHLQRSMKLKPKTVVVRRILSRLYDFHKPGVVSEPDGEEAEQHALIQKLGFRSLFSLLRCDGDFGG
ncbi:hypothetical protein U1Q18_034432 [Sarracenia purpurea var. burkii]